MSEFKKYRRTNISELKIAEQEDFTHGHNILINHEDLGEVSHLMTGENMKAGMVARNPNNHKDQWYVAKKYFEDNFEIIPDYLLYKYEE